MLLCSKKENFGMGLPWVIDWRVVAGGFDAFAVVGMTGCQA